MSKIFKKSILAAAAGVALAAGAVSTANANSLLFPFFASQGNTESYLLMSNGPAANLHYAWYYGNRTSSGALSTGCNHFDTYGSMTANDLQMQGMTVQAMDANGVSGGVAVFPNGSMGAGLPQNLNPNGGGLGNLPVDGFLVVSTVTAVPTTGTTTAAQDLTGQMVVYDPNAGILFAYAGIDSSKNSTTPTDEGDFSKITANQYVVNWYPQSPSLVQTQWYAIAVGNMKASLVGGTNWTGGAAFTNAGNTVYNNKEVAYSGAAGGSFTCRTLLQPSSFLTAAQVAATGPTGGLARVSFTPFGGASGVLLAKVDATPLLVGSTKTLTNKTTLITMPMPAASGAGPAY